MLEPEDDGELEDDEEDDLAELEEMTVAGEINATLKEVQELEAQMRAAKEVPVSVVRLPCCAHKVCNLYRLSILD